VKKGSDLYLRLSRVPRSLLIGVFTLPLFAAASLVGGFVAPLMGWIIPTFGATGALLVGIILGIQELRSPRWPLVVLGMSLCVADSILLWRYVWVPILTAPPYENLGTIGRADKLQTH